MKSSDEMVTSLFKRRERYEAEKKRRIKTTALLAVCIIAVLGYGFGSGGFSPAKKPETKIAIGSIYNGKENTFDPSEGESPDDVEATKGEPIDDVKANEKIVIHKIDSMSSAKFNIDLKPGDFVEMNERELNKYYGCNVFPKVPEDLKESKEPGSKYGIFKKNGGSGEIYWDATVLDYVNENLSRHLNIEIKKVSKNYNCFGLHTDSKEKSCINNIEIFLGELKNGYYCAEFSLYYGVSFRIITEGFTRDEFVAVVRSLVK